jgi:hypothetical protein
LVASPLDSGFAFSGFSSAMASLSPLQKFL